MYCKITNESRSDGQIYRFRRERFFETEQKILSLPTLSSPVLESCGTRGSRRSTNFLAFYSTHALNVISKKRKKSAVHISRAIFILLDFYVVLTFGYWHYVLTSSLCGTGLAFPILFGMRIRGRTRLASFPRRRTSLNRAIFLNVSYTVKSIRSAGST